MKMQYLIGQEYAGKNSDDAIRNKEQYEFEGEAGDGETTIRTCISLPYIMELMALFDYSWHSQ